MTRIERLLDTRCRCAERIKPCQDQRCRELGCCMFGGWTHVAAPHSHSCADGGTSRPAKGGE